MDPDLALSAIAAEEEREAAMQEPSEVDDKQIPEMRTSAGYDLHAQLLTLIGDLIQQLNTTLIAVNLPKGKSPPKVHSLPRPVSAFEVEKARREFEAVDDTLRDLGF